MKRNWEYSKKIKKVKKELKKLQTADKKRSKPKRSIFKRIMVGVYGVLFFTFIVTAIFYFASGTFKMAITEQRMKMNEVEIVILGIETLLETYGSELEQLPVRELPQWLKEKKMQEFPTVRPKIQTKPDSVKEI